MGTGRKVIQLSHFSFQVDSMILLDNFPLKSSNLASLVAPGKWKWREQGTLLPQLPLYLLGGVELDLSIHVTTKIDVPQ